MQISLNTRLRVAENNSGYEANTVQELISFLRDNSYLQPASLQTATVNVAGFSDVSTAEIKYTIMGNLAVVSIESFTGTSNATSFSLDSLPTELLSTLTNRPEVYAPIFDNGASVGTGSVVCPTQGGPPTQKFTFTIGGDFNAFTATNTKGLSRTASIVYHL